MIMRKGFLIIAATLLATAGANAMGPIDFGIKAGLNTGNFDLNKKTFSDAYRLLSNAKTGYHAGAFMRLNFLAFHVQPELVYNWNGYDITTIPTGLDGEKKSKVKVQTLEVPVLAGIDILFLRVNAGPVFNIMTKSSTSKGTIENVDTMKPTVSFAAGVGVDLMKFSFDVRYCGQFTKTDSTITIGNETLDYKNNFQGWQFSLGYKF